MAYYKKKKATIKVNINGRVMIDPSTHRRVNPNYPISHVRPKDHGIVSEDDDSDSEDACGGCGSDSEGAKPAVKLVSKLVQNQMGKVVRMRMRKGALNGDLAPSNGTLTEVAGQGGTSTRATKASDSEKEGSPCLAGEEEMKQLPQFTDEEYLIASPVVLGFAFGEKLWLEFTVSGVKEIRWNESAYESLVLGTKTKDIVKASKPAWTSIQGG